MSKSFAPPFTNAAVAGALMAALSCAAGAQDGAAPLVYDRIADVAARVASPPPDARPLVRWWWFGPAVVPPQLEREIAAMQAGGRLPFGVFGEAKRDEIATVARAVVATAAELGLPLAAGRTHDVRLAVGRFKVVGHLADVHEAAAKK